MTRFHKAIKVVVGIAVFLSVYWFLVRNQIVAEFIRPSVDAGNLGVANANVLTNVIEVLAAVGGVALAMMSRLLTYIADWLETLVVNVDGASTSASTDKLDGQDPKGLTNDLSKLLIQAVIEANRNLTIQLAHRLAKKEFLGDKHGGNDGR